MVAVKSGGAERFLASPPEAVRLLLIYGSDAGGVTERARLVERVALKRGGGDSVVRFDSDMLSAEPGRIADEVYAASLFGGEPVVNLHVLDGRHNVMGALQPILERPPDAAWLVVEAGELNPTNALRKAFEASPRAAAIATYQLAGEDLLPFLHAAAEEAGILIEPAAMEVLAASLGGDRLATRAELEKLFTYAGPHATITAADVEAIVGETAELQNDDIIDAALAGDHEALEIGLVRLKAETASAASLAAQALRHLIMLQGLRAAVDSGTSIGSALERARPPVFSRRRHLVQAQLRDWSSEALVGARRRLADAILLSRKQSALESTAISEALHAIALKGRRLRRS